MTSLIIPEAGLIQDRLFRFTGHGNGETGPTVLQVAASDVHESRTVAHSSRNIEKGSFG